MRNQKLLELKQMDEKMKNFSSLSQYDIPSGGWIHSIRRTLNMTMQQLGEKMGISKQGIRSLEQNESKGTITLKSLVEAGEAMDLQFVYGFIPKDGSLEALIERKSYELARKVVEKTNQTMMLENQSMAQEKLEAATEDLAEEISREISRAIWD